MTGRADTEGTVTTCHGGATGSSRSTPPATSTSPTASTMTLKSRPESAPGLGGIGGAEFNLIEVARGYDATS